MPISAHLNQELNKTLARCRALTSDLLLRAVFVDERLEPWRDCVPENMPSRAARIEALIDALCDQTNVQGENALVLFLQVLAEHTPSKNALHGKLNSLATELKKQLRPPQELSATPLTSRMNPLIPAFIIMAVLLALGIPLVNGAIVWKTPQNSTTATSQTNEASAGGICRIESFAVEPPSPQPVGALIVLPITATCESGVRAIRLMVNDEWYSEKGGHIAPPERFVPAWKTNNLEPGVYELTAEVATLGDDNWEFSASQTIEYILTDSKVGDMAQSTETPAWSPCKVESLTAEPPSPQPIGTLIIFPIRATCKSGIRAIRLMVNGEWLSEKGGHIAPPEEFVPSWNTKALTPGIYQITAEVATWGDDDWEFSASQTIEYTLTNE